jgi:hypothetical protein
MLRKLRFYSTSDTESSHTQQMLAEVYLEIRSAYYHSWACQEIPGFRNTRKKGLKETVCQLVASLQTVGWLRHYPMKLMVCYSSNPIV